MGQSIFALSGGGNNPNAKQGGAGFPCGSAALAGHRSMVWRPALSTVLPLSAPPDKLIDLLSAGLPNPRSGLAWQCPFRWTGLRHRHKNSRVQKSRCGDDISQWLKGGVRKGLLTGVPVPLNPQNGHLGLSRSFDTSGAAC